MLRVVLLAAGAVLAASAMPAGAQAPGASDSKPRCFAAVTPANAAQAKAACSATLALSGLSATEKWTALFNRASAQAHLGEDEAAARDYTQSIQAAPANAERSVSYLSRGLHALMQGAVRPGEADVAQAISLRPELRQAGVPDAVMGGYYACGNGLGGAEIVINNCGRVLAAGPLGAEPRTVALVMRARALAMSDDLPAAEKDLATAVSIAPTPALSAAAYEVRGQVRVKAGRKAEGDADLAKAASLRRGVGTQAAAGSASAPAGPAAGLQSRPPSAGGLTDSQLQSRFLRNEAWGLRCYFRHVPELSMAMRDNAAASSLSEFIVTPRGHERSLLNEFRLTLRAGSPPSGRFTVQKPAFGAQRIRGATLWVDGRQVATGLETRQQRKSSGGGYYDNIGVVLPAQHVAALEAARTAEVAVYDEATRAEAGRWSYDVSRLRYVGRALELSKGQCS